jgi:hypothetical protein
MSQILPQTKCHKYVTDNVTDNMSQICHRSCVTDDVPNIMCHRQYVTVNMSQTICHRYCHRQSVTDNVSQIICHRHVTNVSQIMCHRHVTNNVSQIICHRTSWAVCFALYTKVKVKLSLYLTTHYAAKEYGGVDV